MVEVKGDNKVKMRESNGEGNSMIMGVDKRAI